ATWAPSKDLNVEVGARLEVSKISATVSGADSEKTLNFVKPRLNLSWSPAKGHQLGLRAERLVDQLSFGSFLSNASFETDIFGVGNPDIEPARRWEFEARYERQFGGQNSFVAKLVHSELDHIIASVVIILPPDSAAPGLQVQIPRNVAEASRDVLDLNGSLELDGLGMKGGLFQVGANIQTSHTIDPVTGFERSLSNNQDWAWNGTLSQTLDGGAFRWSVFASNYSSSTSYSPQSISRNSHESIYGGASFSWRPAPGWTIGGSINRIFNVKDHYTFILFDEPRDTGSEAYRERFWSPVYSSATLSIRKNF
ncbi:MAG TPA: TonB-dependent receptor, partial [Hyphomonadaceae bacterium]|nr:TonB-dependent receptor [Hyphomonadaceae bacterium]